MRPSIRRLPRSKAAPKTPSKTAQQQAAPAVAQAKSPQHREVIVAKGDTLSTLFEKVGLPATTVNDVLASDKQAKQFTQLKHGQKLEFELTPDGQLNNLHSNVSDLESITLTKGAKGFAFNRITTKPVMRSAYVHGVDQQLAVAIGRPRRLVPQHDHGHGQRVWLRHRLRPGHPPG